MTAPRTSAGCKVLRSAGSSCAKAPNGIERLALGALTALALPIGIATAASPSHDDRTVSDTSTTTLTAVEIPATACGTTLFGDDFVRTELFFGLSRPGGRITERQFARFVDHEVTPRFPDGLTLLSGLGQFRLDSGQIIEEKSKVLVLLHPGGEEASAAIEAIRDEYIDEFDQQAVLRTDESSCASF